jgi:hypothetical protein
LDRDSPEFALADLRDHNGSSLDLQGFIDNFFAVKLDAALVDHA